MLRDFYVVLALVSAQKCISLIVGGNYLPVFIAFENVLLSVACKKGFTLITWSLKLQAFEKNTICQKNQRKPNILSAP